MMREPNLLEYLPLFMEKYREITAIMKTENPEFKLMFDESETVKNNQFIVSCNSNGIKRFEQILGLSATDQEPLKSRISRVLNRWNDNVPYTFKAFLEKLDTLCGEDVYTIVKKFSEYKMEIETHLDKYGEVDELQYLLQYIMPSNIQIVSKNQWYFDVVGKMEIAACMVIVNTFELSNDFKEYYIMNATANVATGIVECSVKTLTNDSNELKELHGNLKFGGSFIGDVECVITDSVQEIVNINSSVKTGSGVDFVSIITI